jgi:hypothetical protein
VSRSDWDDQRLRTHARDVLSKNRTLVEATFTELADNLMMGGGSNSAKGAGNSAVSMSVVRTPR